MFSPFANMPRRQKQAGTAIIMAMLTVALVAGIAARILADYGHAVDQLAGRHDQAQARWLARGAIDWARNVLESDFNRGGGNRVDHLREEWAIKVPPTPFEEGELSGELEELSGRFNVNSLIIDGKLDEEQLKRFNRLLQAAGIAQMQAEQLSAALIDWIDQDDEPYGQKSGSESLSYRQQADARVPTQGFLLDPDELKFIRGYTPQILQLIKSHVTALPATASWVNVNTATAPVLQAYVEDLTAAQANALIVDRDRSFFTSVENFKQRLPPTSKPAENKLMVSSRHWYANGRARWGEAVTKMQVLLDRASARPDILWVKIQ